MCSFFGAYLCTLIFAVVDILQGLSVLIFYSYQQYKHRYCTYAHGILECEYFLFKSNHSKRVLIGIGEGLICIMISCLLIYFVYKRHGWLVWGWLLKPVTFLILNLYFVGVWMVERGRYYHTYNTEEESVQETLFIYFGAATAALHVVLALWFCCSAGGFSYQLRKQRRSSQYSSCETKV